MILLCPTPAIHLPGRAVGRHLGAKRHRKSFSSFTAYYIFEELNHELQERIRSRIGRIQRSLPRHSRAGGNPVAGRERATKGWVLACAGMTVIGPVNGYSGTITRNDAEN